MVSRTTQHTLSLTRTVCIHSMHAQATSAGSAVRYTAIKVPAEVLHTVFCTMRITMFYGTCSMSVKLCQQVSQLSYLTILHQILFAHMFFDSFLGQVQQRGAVQLCCRNNASRYDLTQMSCGQAVNRERSVFCQPHNSAKSFASQRRVARVQEEREIEDPLKLKLRRDDHKCEG